MTIVTALDDGLHCIDLQFQGRSGVIASYLIEDSGERALIEVGPGSTFDVLVQSIRSLGIEPSSISKVLVTHIHLDHAGAAGTFIRSFPRAQLYVHEAGAVHMMDPARLLKSAQRIYGEQMDALWGAFEPVPEANVHTVSDGDRIVLGNRELHVAYTPGHASHHVAYHDPMREAVFTGDVAGVRLQGFDYVRPPTPPPDLELDQWDSSVARIRQLDPHVLYLTHFGPFADVETHLSQLPARLRGWEQLLKKDLAAGHDRARLIGDLTRFGDREVMESTDEPSVIEKLELATPYYMSVDGYLRYFKQQSGG